MPTCTCPAAAAIPSIDKITCAQDFGQIQKIAFQRIYSSGSTRNSFVGTGTPLAPTITTLAAWQTFLSSATGTKIAVTPYVENPTPDGGDAITFGGGNQTLGGIVKTIGRNPINMTFDLRQFPQSIIKELKKLMCEVELGVYLFNADGKIAAIQDATTPTTYYPIPIRNLFVGDLMMNGLETPDSNTLSFSFPPDYSDDLAIVTPTDFNPLLDL
jgi:hypothetical protein